MNKDQFEGTLKEFAGTVQERLGKLIGNLLQQDMGVELQNKGRLQVFLGDLKKFEELETHGREFDKRWYAWVKGGG
jgi:uncharacterized protein YjbJ (UPF0337 family)